MSADELAAHRAATLATLRSWYADGSSYGDLECVGATPR